MFNLSLENCTEEQVKYAMGKSMFALSEMITGFLEGFTQGIDKGMTLAHVEAQKKAYIICAFIYGIDAPFEEANAEIDRIIENCVWDDGVKNEETGETIQIEELYDLCADGFKK